MTLLMGDRDDNNDDDGCLLLRLGCQGMTVEVDFMPKDGSDPL